MEFKPDLVWIKSRSNNTWNNLFDTVRGADRALYTNSGNAQTGPHQPSRLSSFIEDGFTLGANTDINALGEEYVAWCWKAGDSEATNVNGSIISTVRSNPTYGFSVVKYDGTGANATVGHGLGAPADMIMVKRMVGGNQDWSVYHSGAQITGAKSAKINVPGAAFVNDSTTWQNQAPNSTNFSIGTNPESNSPVQSHIAYCWTSIPGFSSFGEYDGTGGKNFIYCGFKPAFVMLKCHNAPGQQWNITDSSRVGPDGNTILFPDNDAPENASSYMQFLDNGFLINTGSGFANATGGFKYIYAAFAEKPAGF